MKEPGKVQFINSCSKMSYDRIAHWACFLPLASFAMLRFYFSFFSRLLGRRLQFLSFSFLNTFASERARCRSKEEEKNAWWSIQSVNSFYCQPMCLDKMHDFHVQKCAKGEKLHFPIRKLHSVTFYALDSLGFYRTLRQFLNIIYCMAFYHSNFMQAASVKETQRREKSNELDCE